MSYLIHYGVKGMKWKNRKDSSYRMESTLLTGSGLSRTIADIGVNDYKQKKVNDDNQRGENRTKQFKEKSSKKAKKKKFKNPFAPKNQKVTIESFKDEKTGIDYKK